MRSDHASLVEHAAETARSSGLSGVVALSIGGAPLFEQAYGLADRAHGIGNDTGTRFGTASLTKGFTALAVMSLVESGELSLGTRARAHLGDDLPLVDDAVTIEHLLSHTSGIGDYLDEDSDWEVDDYVLPVPVQDLATTEGFLTVLDGHAQKTAPGTEFSYCNGGFMLLALIAERASGTSFHDLVSQRVFEPAGMGDTAFLRLDELPGDAAIGYLSEDPQSLRTNVLHLPVRGNGDGGAFTTVGDLDRFWRALAEDRIVSADVREQMLRPRNVDEGEDLRYGLGFYLDDVGPGAILTGFDAGVSSWTRFDPETGLVATVLSNTPEGAWETARTIASETSVS